MGLGFGAANAALVRQLGVSGAGAIPATVSTSDERAADTATPEKAPSVTNPPSIDNVDPPAPGHLYDTVIRGGRVIDPESGFDAIANVGIDGEKITAISFDELQSSNPTIEAAGLVVSPGFIDILSYSPNGYGEWFKIQDGVTTNLLMHGADAFGEDFFAKIPGLGNMPVHYGGASDNAVVRERVGELGPYEEPNAAKIDQIVARTRRDLEAGLIGIHMQPEYTPGATSAEVLANARLAAELGVPLCVHARYSDNLPPGTQAEAMTEVVRVAEQTGVWMHVEHINSTGGTGRMAEALGTLEDARSQGHKITACVYPYQFWATYLASPRYDNWQEKYGISYGDLQIAGTSERLNESTYGPARSENKLTAAFTMSEEDLEIALRTPWVMVGSDAILERAHNNHPRSTGCFARTMGRYVRDRNAMDLVSALAKVTVQPAQLVEAAAPAMRRKGRLQMGADADITIFDLNTISDQSSIETPQIPSTGVSWVLVNGTPVLTPDGLDETVSPGTPITSRL